MVVRENGVIDFQEWNVPTSWDEVTLKQFQEIEKFYEGKDKDFNVKEVLQIFCQKTEDEVNELPIEFTEKILEHLQFVNTKFDWGESKNWVEIDGERYTIHFENQLKTGEYIMVDSIIKSDPHNYASILAVLCRKEGEIYDSKFENEILPSRVEMFERMPVTKLMGLVAFFFDLSLLYMNNSQLFTQTEAVLNHIRKHYETSIRNGRWWELCTLLQTKKLQKLLKSIKYTS
jgi:hypothetical protein